MPITVKAGPLTRIEGHLDIEAVIGNSGGHSRVVQSARSAGVMFRGFEIVLVGRDPRDAPHYTQRICGVCPTSHGMASALALDAAFKVVAPANGRILRNLILGADFLQSHILHFYHLALLDYVDTTGQLDQPPWTPRYTTPCMITGADAGLLVSHYVQALTFRRKCHQMGAIFGGRMPCSPRYVAGGCSETVTTAQISSFRSLLTEVRSFITVIYLPDIDLLARWFPEYWTIGRGCGNLLSFGVFDLDSAGTSKLLARGRYTGDQLAPVDDAQITEDVQYSWYAPAPGGQRPVSGTTVPQWGKLGAYSWIKAPRYQGLPYEVGPLARMWVNGDYRRGISVLDRLKARALEAQKLADAMDGWLNKLTVGGATQTTFAVPASASGVGLSEAPRGALGHWVQIANSVIQRYQVVSPTSWNASPKDDFGQSGPIEQALTGTPVADPAKPIELLRVVHSFDPCLACSVH